MRRPRPHLVACLLAATLAAQQPDGRVLVEAGDAMVTSMALVHVHALAESGLDRLAPTFPGFPNQQIRIVAHSSAQTLPAILRDELHVGTPGLALLGRNEIRVLLDEAVQQPPNDLRTVVVHELVHVLLDQWAGAAGPHVPRWLHEGLAQSLSGAAYYGLDEENLLFAVATGSAPRFGQLVRGFPENPERRRLAYAQSLSFVSFLVDRLGLQPILAAARRCGPDVAFHDGLFEETRAVLIDVQMQWEDHVVYRSGAIARFMLRHCFTFLTILALPLLLLAVGKRIRQNRLRRLQLERDEYLAKAILAAEDDSIEHRPERDES